MEDSITSQESAAAAVTESPAVGEEEDADGEERRIVPAEAATQTSPMSLSRSSSFLWVSDCNCSGSLEDGSAPMASVSGPALSSSCPDPSVSSEAGSSGGASRIVHMDTSTASSLVSLESGRQRTHRHHHSRNNRGRMCTPDSAADVDEDDDEEDDDDDDDEGKVTSPSFFRLVITRDEEFVIPS